MSSSSEHFKTPRVPHSNIVSSSIKVENILNILSRAGPSSGSSNVAENGEPAQKRQKLYAGDVASRSSKSKVGKRKRYMSRHVKKAKPHRTHESKQALYKYARRVARKMDSHRKRARYYSSKLRRHKKTRPDRLEEIPFLPKKLRTIIQPLLKGHRKRHKHPYRLTLNERCLFVPIYSRFPQCYRFLNKYFPLPSSRSLQNILTNWPLDAGINDQFFEFLDRTSSIMPAWKRKCILMFNEISFTTTVGFSKKTMVPNEQAKTEDHALVFMIRDVTGTWKQIVAFYYSFGSVSGAAFKQHLVEIIRAIHERTEFRIIASICNGKPSFADVLHALTIESVKYSDDFTYNIDGYVIVHMFNVPQMLLCLRNTFMTTDIIYDKKLAKWSHLVELQKTDDDVYLKVTKITKVHINPQQRQKMKLRYVTELFNKTTAGILSLLVNGGITKVEGTRDFVYFMSKILDSVNSTDPAKKPLHTGSRYLVFFQKTMRALAKLEFVERGKPIPQPPYIQYLICTIRNGIFLWNSVRDMRMNKFKLRSFNLNSLQNFFSLVRSFYGPNSRLSPAQFKDAVKCTILTNAVKIANSSSCDDDSDRYLRSLKLLLNIKSTSTTSNPSTSSYNSFTSPYNSSTSYNPCTSPCNPSTSSCPSPSIPSTSAHNPYEYLCIPSTSSYNPYMAMCHPSTSTFNPYASIYNPSTSSYNPYAAIYRPSTSSYNPYPFNPA